MRFLVSRDERGPVGFNEAGSITTLEVSPPTPDQSLLLSDEHRQWGPLCLINL